MAGGVRSGVETLNLPHLTRRELLQQRARLTRAIKHGRNTETSTGLLTRIEAELEARRILRFDNAARDVPPLYAGLRDEEV